jgi:hypothetical protein
MSAREIGWRCEDYAKKFAWFPQQVVASPSWRDISIVRKALTATTPVPRSPDSNRLFAATISPDVFATVPSCAAEAVTAAADEILSGRWVLLGVNRSDMEDPDWFFDPVTGRDAPGSQYCFWIDHRSEEVTGNVKQVWELSRLQHVTVLAAAFALSGDERYADRAARHLESWWSKNPFLSGIHWTSGIELGLRLISWVWARRLLEGWDGARALFEGNRKALEQIWWHQRYLARFRSRGSSANNHVIAEAAGQLVASLAFDWFDESPKWAAGAAAVLQEELEKNTFPTGVNREMAFEYHGFVAELGIVAAVEADLAGRPLSDSCWQLLHRMVEVVAATVDVQLRPPRLGDGDDGRALLLDPPDTNRWESLIALGTRLFGAPDWWPECQSSASSVLIASLAGKRRELGSSPRRPSHFSDAGITVLRSQTGSRGEIWCLCDAGPHGFLSIAAHAHADALALEVRCDGTEILADPGTYCYHGEPASRRYFRSTLGHNTIEIAHQDQSASGGPTLWTRHARSRLLTVDFDDEGDTTLWSAEHDGYGHLDPPALHRRTVELNKQHRFIRITDVIETTGDYSLLLAFHLGPHVDARQVSGRSFELTWVGASAKRNVATIDLPDLNWSMFKGSTDPVLGWYSAHFGEKEPAISIVGEGNAAELAEMRTILRLPG